MYFMVASSWMLARHLDAFQRGRRSRPGLLDIHSEKNRQTGQSPSTMRGTQVPLEGLQLSLRQSPSSSQVPPSAFLATHLPVSGLHQPSMHWTSSEHSPPGAVAD